MNEVEYWVPIGETDGLYEVSNIGRVQHQGGIPLRPRVKNSGYLFVTITVNGKRVNRYVHQLVAGAFIGPRPKGLDVNHKNGIKIDNRANNLEYVTRAQNMEHAVKVGLHTNFGEKHYNAKLTAELVDAIRRAHSLCGVSAEEMAPSLNASVRTIQDVLDGKTWKSVPNE